MKLIARSILAALTAAALAFGVPASSGAATPAQAASSDASRTSEGPDADRARYDRLCTHVAESYENARGGFVAKNGRPACLAITLAFAIARDGGTSDWAARARATVNWTWSLYDSVGGGFLESEHDVRHDEPAFEKRTDSNALRLDNLIDAYLSTGDEIYRRRAAQVMDFFDRVLLDARGGFVAGQIGDRDLIAESDGLAIQSWLRWTAINPVPRLRNFAWKSLDRTWDECWNADLGMLRRDSFGEILKAPQLVDQVETGRAFALAAHVGGRASDLDRARTIADLLLSRFEDPQKGGFRVQAVPDKKGKTKSAARVPEENARAALFLAELASVSGDPKYREAARRTIGAFEKKFDKGGFELAGWALALRALSKPDLPARPEWKTASPPKPSAEPAAPAIKKKHGR